MPPLPPHSTILQVIPDLNTGGAERTTLDIAKAVVDAGGKSLVVSQGGQLVAELLSNGTGHIDLPVKSKNPITIWQNANDLEELIKEHKVSLIHARSRAPAWSALLAARRTKIPFVTTYHGIYNQKNALKALYNSVMARGDCVIANSIYTAKLIQKRHPIANKKIRVIQRGSDLRSFDRANISMLRKQVLQDQWNIPARRPIILNVARLTSWKGQTVLIEAMAKLKRQDLGNPVAVFAGDAQGRTAYLAELKQLIADHGLQDDTRLVGHCADVPAAMALASVAVVTSVEPEAFGRAAVEAQAASVPVIVSDLGAVPETVLAPPQTSEDKRTGWRVPPNNAEALAAAIETTLTQDPMKTGGMVERALAHVQENFSLETMCSRTLSVYSDLIGN